MFTVTRRPALTLAASVALLACAGGLTACSSSGNATSSATPGTLTVETSFYPIEYLASAIGGGHVSVSSVTPTNVEPHDFELSPRDVTDLGNASLIVYVAGFQPSLDDALTQISGPTVLNLADDVKLVHHEGVAEEEEHPGAPASASATRTSASKDASTSPKDSVSLDPHFWLDPARMTSAAEAIATSLSTVDPNHSADYTANLTTLKNTLSSLDQDARSSLTSCRRTTFVTSHAAFGYLADSYGLTQASITGIDPESEPSPAEIAAVKKIVQSTATTTIFTESLLSPATAKALASETGATTDTLDPIESAPDGGDYASALKTDIAKLSKALDCAK